MSSALRNSHGVIHIGRKALHASRHALERDLGEGAAACLQEMGYAAGEELYQGFTAWLPRHAGVKGVEALDADALGDVLSAFFEEAGWGSLTLERLGEAGLALSSPDWAEAEPGSNAAAPSCHFTSGLLADFLTRLAGGDPVAIMEVECRSRDDARCRFFAGAPDTLDALYQAMSAGEDYEALLTG